MLDSALVLPVVDAAFVVADAGFFDVYGLPLFLMVLCLVGLWGGYDRFKRKRLIQNIPTSKVKGVMMGLNELKGKAVTHTPLRAYLSEKDVVYYKYKIEEQYKRKVKRKGKTKTKKGWKTIDSGERSCMFELHDDTGSIRVRPEGADFEADREVNRTCRKMDPMYYGKGPRRSVRGSTGRRRFKEWIIKNNDEIYLMGSARVREDICEPEIADDEDAPLFLISSKSEEELIRQYAWTSVLAFIIAIASGVGAPPALTHLALDAGVNDPLGGHSTLLAILAGVGLVLFILFLYVKTIYDGLVDLRHRESRAWSMLDVEFKRRADLIPKLVEIVQALSTHEQKLQEAVAAARSGRSIGDSPDEADTEQAAEAIDQQSEALGQVFAIAEDYPEIKSDQHFEKLMEELTRCEDKIALARQFYNDSVERLNNRVETVPDKFLADVANAEKEDFLEISEFERKPVEVDLTPDEPEDQTFGDEDPWEKDDDDGDGEAPPEDAEAPEPEPVEEPA